ncbi:CC-NBS-LRR class disease resistance protein [Dorcoceras hygrometricum]|uniref:CC-NBS-LRR class disease resistance protein n=1 Tax=Dorcoceras hygrometricum TaxID=472368 RepID=A0A2Z7D9F9_9LAMI|nr:CC-NBS-LRR class disease resistance protein [Dorcoceras hygrometricum]
MTSSVTSSSRKIQQVACIPDARGSDVVEDPVASYSAISRCYLKIAKRCRLHKLIRQRFALALKIQQEDFALLFQQTKLQCIQSQRKDIQSQDEPVASNSSIQSRAYLNQLLLINQSQALHIQSTWFPGAKN